MTWHTIILNKRIAPFILAEQQYPYLTALALGATAAGDHLSSRIANLLSARRQEERRRLSARPAMPYHYVVDPSSACNLRCPLCVQATDRDGRTRTTMAFHLFEQILREIETVAIRLDLFNWGEPYVNPHFIQMIEAAAVSGLYVRTSSNLTLRRPRLAEETVASGLHYLVASIDGATQETYANYRVRGRLSIAVDNLKAIAEEKHRRGSVFPIVEWQYMVFAHNAHEIEEARSLAIECGADVFRYGGARARMSAKTLMSEPDAFALSQDTLLPPDHELSEYDRGGQRRSTWEREGCRWLWGKMALNADGGVSPCWNGWFRTHDLGNLRQQSVAELWGGSAFMTARAAAIGSSSSDSMCGRCAANRAFVPTPDFDREDMGHGIAAQAVALGLNALGRQPPPRLSQLLRDRSA